MSELAIDVDPGKPPQTVTREHLTAAMQAMGLQSGDSVLVHAALSSFGRVEGGARTVIEALLAAIGSDGTLMAPYFFPLYDGAFDYGKPPLPYTGAVPRLLRTWPGAILSVHPSHPVVAVGPAAAEVTEGHYRVSAVGRGSPFDRLAKLGGKVLLLGVRQSANTTIHTGEAYASVPYWGQPRADRPAGRWTVMPDGREAWVPLIETPGDSAGFPKIEPMLIERGLITFGLVGRARCRLMPGQPLIETIVDLLRRNPGGLLCDRQECAFCVWARQMLASPTGPAGLAGHGPLAL